MNILGLIIFRRIQHDKIVFEENVLLIVSRKLSKIDENILRKLQIKITKNLIFITAGGSCHLKAPPFLIYRKTSHQKSSCQQQF